MPSKYKDAATQLLKLLICILICRKQIRSVAINQKSKTVGFRWIDEFALGLKCFVSHFDLIFFRDWLAENNYNDSGAVTSVEAAWGLLKKLVDQLEIKGQTGLKKAVAVRLLSLGASFPAWIITSFKETNAAELLHLYLVHGYVLLASVLAVEYIEAALGI